MAAKQSMRGRNHDRSGTGPRLPRPRPTTSLTQRACCSQRAPHRQAWHQIEELASGKMAGKLICINVRHCEAPQDLTEGLLGRPLRCAAQGAGHGHDQHSTRPRSQDIPT